MYDAKILKLILNLKILTWTTEDHLVILSRNYLSSYHMWCTYPYLFWAKLLLIHISLEVAGINSINFIKCAECVVSFWFFVQNTTSQKKRTTIEITLTNYKFFSFFFFYWNCVDMVITQHSVTQIFLYNSQITVKGCQISLQIKFKTYKS